jgi:peptidoglycan-N-acetylglucosamine deacetylase
VNVRLNRFPEGRLKAVTLSFDDGRDDDRQLVKLMNDYSLRGTFHLNSGTLGKDSFITAEEARELYQGHEISAHTVSHPFLNQISVDRLIREIVEDRLALEHLAGCPVRGMSYPYGIYSDSIVRMLAALGMEYARTTASTGKLAMPADFLEWHPTCHHKDMVACAERLVQSNPWGRPMELLYVWGHSYEFERDGNWELMNRFGETAGGRSDIWYATNAEVVAYAHAMKRLRFTASEQMVENPSAIPVWIESKGEAVKIPPQALVCL